jgi:hypothetical protein
LGCLNWIRRLNNNSLSGEFPMSLANMTQLVLLYVSWSYSCKSKIYNLIKMCY